MPWALSTEVINLNTAKFDEMVCEPAEGRKEDQINCKEIEKTLNRSSTFSLERLSKKRYLVATLIVSSLEAT